MMHDIDVCISSGKHTRGLLNMAIEIVGFPIKKGDFYKVVPPVDRVQLVPITPRSRTCGTMGFYQPLCYIHNGPYINI